MAPIGVVIPLQLTHETLGRLIGARRPTVSLALKELDGDNLLERRADGAWLLHYEALERLGAEGRASSSWQPADARPVEIEAVPGELPAELTPEAFRMTKDDMRALRARVDVLREEHAARLARCASTLERARAARVQRTERRPTG